jgi:phosphodiesterase/alkaline phosphatase D-like protein
LVLLGDQIYADATANVADPRSPWVRYEEATERWMELPGVRDVLAQVPVYMMLDDHEIDDQYEPNMWPPGSPRARLLPQALETFHRWQGSLAPNSEHPLRRTPDEYNPYFDFFPGGYPFFVLNTRTRRDPRSYRAQGRVKVSEQAAIIDAEQMAALKRFLSAAQKVAPLSPKFIASPSVVFPEVGMRSQRSLLRCDGWSGFGRSTSDLISFIEEQGIENVVFLCGDYHASAAASATTKSKGCRLLSIVSSGLYAPYPFANAQIRDFVSGARPIDSDLPLAEVKVRYCTNRNGFAVVDVKPRSIAAKGPRLTVTFHYSDGSASKRICLS